MVKIKVKSAASSWWAARHKILAEIKGSKQVRAKAKNVKVKHVVKGKKMVKGQKAIKQKKAAKSKKVTKAKKTKR